MANNRSLIQSQWSLDNTVFKTAGALLDLVQAAAQDDVQSQAVIAFEALGSAILPSPDRIDEGLDALRSRGRFQNLRYVKVVVGLFTNGVSQLICRRAPQCVPAFLLVTALKTCLSDQAISNVLYEMLCQQDLLRKVPVSRSSMEILISSISGYSDTIIPGNRFENVSTAILQNIARRNHCAKALCEPDPKLIAEIFTRTFEALRKVETQRLTIRGLIGGALIASSILWLLAEPFELTVDGKLAMGVTGGKVGVEICSTESSSINGTWTMQEWQKGRHEGSMLPTIIVQCEENYNNAMSTLDFFPALGARSVLAAQYELDEDETEEVGIIAEALVIASINTAVIKSDMEYAVQPHAVPFKRICQQGFLSQASTYMKVYGWGCNEAFIQKAQMLSEAIVEWIKKSCPNVGQVRQQKGHPLFQEPLTQLSWVMARIEDWRRTRPGSLNIECSFEKKFIEPGLHLAAECIYSSICDTLPAYRTFRGCRFTVVADNALNIMHLLFSGILSAVLRKCNPPITLSNLNSMEDLTMTELRVRTIESLVPGSTNNVGNRDLIFGMNGLVAYMAPLRKVSTRPLDCAAVSILPGFIRWGEGDPSAGDFRFDRLSSVELQNNAGKTEDATNARLEAFGGTYPGLELQQDKNDTEIECLISATGKKLTITTYLRRPNSRRTMVDWISSVSAAATARQIITCELPAFAEEQLARSWLERGIWQTIGLTSADGVIVHQPSTPIRYIGSTHGNESLRFFLAGRRPQQIIFMRQGTTPLIQCIRAALEFEADTQNYLHGESGSTVGYSNAMPYPEPSFADAQLQRGWLIIA